MSQKRFVVEDDQSRHVEIEASDWMMAMVRATQALGATPSGFNCEPRGGGVVFVTDPGSGGWWRVTPKEDVTARLGRRALWSPDGTSPPPSLAGPTRHVPPPPPNLQERLFEASAAIARQPTAEDAAGHALSLALALVPCEAGSVFRVTPDGRAFEFLVVEGGAGDTLLGRLLPVDQGIVGAAYQAEVSIRVEDASSDPRHMSEIDDQTGFSTKALVCAPAVSDAGFRGAIELLNPTDGFAPWHIDVVTQLAQGLAGFVEPTT